MAAPNASFSEGFVPYVIGGEEYKTYYKLFGVISKDSRPLIALHGGPGMAHDYMLPISDLSLPGPQSRPILFYDQIGNGRSSHFKGKPKEFFTVDLFVNELLNIIKHFKLTEYHIVGHSWGGMLAAEFETRIQPEGLKSIIFSDSLTATALWGQSQMKLVSQMPEGKEVMQLLGSGFGDPAKYRSGLEMLHAAHGCLVRPVPKELTYSVLDTIFGDKETGEGGDSTVTVNMFTGVLNGWNISDKLDKVRVPSFVINGRKDLAQDFVTADYFWKIKKSKWVTFENSSHVPMWEERERYNQLVGEWLNSIQ